MKIKEIISEIDRIAKIEDPNSCQTEVRILDERIKDISVKIIERGNYAYFYPYTVVYQPDIKVNREKLKKRIGKLSIEEYHKNKTKIKKMSCKELKCYLLEENIISELAIMDLDNIKESDLHQFVRSKAIKQDFVFSKEDKREMIDRARLKRKIGQLNKNEKKEGK